MAIKESQMPERCKTLIDEGLSQYKQGTHITRYTAIPITSAIPLDNPHQWLRIPDVICVFVDMKGSTQFSASTQESKTASAYQFFTGTAVRLFHEFDAPYIDVRGDGVFALFNEGQEYRALAAAVTFKTFARDLFEPTVKEVTELSVPAHIGIDQKTVLVKKVGLRKTGGRSDRQNEVWAGKPINMASKLAGRAGADELLVSDRFFDRLHDEHALKSCGCRDGTPVQKSELWAPVDVSEAEGLFDFETAYVLKSRWCPIHGKEYCEAILRLD